MKLVDDWRRVVSHSLSFWLQIIGLIMMIGPELRYRLTGQDYDPFIAWWFGALLLLAGIAGRLIQQNLPVWRERLRVAAVILVAIALAMVLASHVAAAPLRAGAPVSPTGPATEAQTLAIAVPFIAAREGERLVAYIPIKGDRPTICFGETEGVHLDMTRTHAQCLVKLQARAAEFRNGLRHYFTATTIRFRLPATRDAAFTSLAYNCGVGAIGRSTAVKRLNAGLIRPACEAMTWWKRAGGRVVRGLFVRRKAEESLCLEGLG